MAPKSKNPVGTGAPKVAPPDPAETKADMAATRKAERILAGLVPRSNPNQRR